MFYVPHQNGSLYKIHQGKEYVIGLQYPYNKAIAKNAIEFAGKVSPILREPDMYDMKKFMLMHTNFKVSKQNIDSITISKGQLSLQFSEDILFQKQHIYQIAKYPLYNKLGVILIDNDECHSDNFYPFIMYDPLSTTAFSGSLDDLF